MGKRVPTCDCGHARLVHFQLEGACDGCACTWYHPNVKAIEKDRKAVEEALAAVPTDYRGEELRPGRRVAFNLSGTVALGEIVSARMTKSIRRSWGWEYEYDIRVRVLHDHPNQKAGHISRLKNNLNLVVL